MKEYDVVTRTLSKKRYYKASKEETCIEAPCEEIYQSDEVSSCSEIEPVSPPERKADSYRMKRKLAKQQAEIKEKMLAEYEQRINEDGYYDEIRPADSGTDFRPKVKHEWWKYAIVGTLFLFGIIMIVRSIGELIG